MAITLERESTTSDGERGRPHRGDRAGRRGVPLRHVRGHARQAVRQDGPGLRHRGPHGRRGGLRRVRRRAHGPDAVVARHPGHARPELVHAGAVAARVSASSSATPMSWASRGRSRPGSSCAASSSAWPTVGYALKVGAEAEYFLVRRTDEGGIAVADPQDQAAAPCYDARALTRMYDHLTTVSRHMNTLGLGQLRQRPRGRQRAVRAELPLRRPADHGGPGHRVPLHGAQPGRRGRHARHVHAQAVLAPHRQRPAHAPEPVGRGGRHGAVRRRRGSAAVSGCRRMGYSFIGGLARPRRGAGGGRLPHGELVQAVGQPGPELGCGLVARLRHLRRQRPHAHVAGARPRPGGGPLHRRLGQPVPGDERADRRRPRRHRPRGSTPATPASSTCWQLRGARGRRARAALHADDAVARASSTSRRDEVLREGLGKTPEGDYVDYFVATKRAEVRSSHAEVTPWELERYLQAF